MSKNITRTYDNRRSPGHVHLTLWAIDWCGRRLVRRAREQDRIGVGMSDMFLSADELRELTCRVQHAAQVKVLRGMGIEHRVRPDGTVAVMRAHVEKVFGAGPATGRKATPKEIDWEALHAARRKK